MCLKNITQHGENVDQLLFPNDKFTLKKTRNGPTQSTITLETKIITNNLKMKYKAKARLELSNQRRLDSHDKENHRSNRKTTKH